MHIEHEVKLDYKDVLIRPKRSTLTSRSEVDITREFSFRHARTPYRGIPIIAANMDTIGTFEMALALDRFGLSTALHKHYGVDGYAGFFRALERKGFTGLLTHPKTQERIMGDPASKRSFNS